MALTNLKTKQAKPKEKPYKLSDEKGLYLHVTTKGQKYWRMDYRYGGKRKTLALGVYPSVTLAMAREGRDLAKKQLNQDIDPAEVKRAKKVTKALSQDNSFKVIAKEWYEKEKPHWSDGHTKRVNRIITKDLVPILGTRIIGEITGPELLACLRKVESRGAVNTAHRVKQVAGMIFRYAVATGRAERDPSADLKEALATPAKTHFASVTEPKEVGKLLNMIEGYEGTPEVAAALKLAPLLFCRPKELRYMEWQEVKWKKQEWHIPGEKMKTGQDHIVPLARQAVAILKELQTISRNPQYVFPSVRSSKRPMSDNAVLSALRRQGITKEQMTGHGFRAMARTLLDEELEYPIEWIECQLAHTVKDANGRAYNRTTYLKQRKEMMQRWADYLDSLKAEAINGNVVTGKFKVSYEKR